MIHYDNLIKAEKMKYYNDYETLLFARAKGKIKSVTGVLPLTFTANAGAAADWVIYGNDDNGTENLFDKSNAEMKGHFYPSSNNKIAVSNGIGSITVPCEPLKTYTIKKFQSTRFQAFTTSEYPVSNGNRSDVVADNTATSLSITSRSNDHYLTVYLWSNSTDTLTYDDIINTVVVVQGSTAPDHYIPYQKGVGERTENVCTSPTAQTKTNGALSVTADGQGRYNISISSTISTQTEVSFDVPEFTIPISVSQGGNGTFSMFNTVKSGVYIVFYYNDTQIDSWHLNAANRQMNSYSLMGNKQCNKIVVRIEGTVYAGTAKCAIMFTNDGILPATYIPYGYQIPLAISQTGQADKNYDIFIGDSPLTAGQQVSKTSTGQDIELFNGENTVDTSLYNKPEMKIDYK